jgi:4-hydroxy-tetrahydrodipicolinate synthase
VPYYNKPMQAGIYLHFNAVAECTTLPIILHDAPSRTQRELSDETLLRLARSRNIVGLSDGNGDIARSLRLRSLLGTDFRLLCGDDVAALACLACGADGCVSTVANVAPELCQSIYSSCRQGRMRSARYLHKRIAPLAACLAKENPAALKYALCMLGFMHPCTRLPIVELSESAKTDVERSVVQLGDEELACPA